MQDPSTYGASFADVYDSWYPGGDEAEIVAFLADRVRAGGHVIELGVGTGRIALELAAAGWEVTGLDSSEEMLEALTAKDPRGGVRHIHGDAADPDHWPEQPADCVLAACNLLLNLCTADAQHRAVQAAADHLRPGGILVVELSLLAVPEADEQRVEASTVRADSVVLITTQTDATTRVVTGNHVELVHGERVRLRPWSIRILDLAELDRFATAAGLVLRERHADWTATPSNPERDRVAVSVYGKA